MHKIIRNCTYIVVFFVVTVFSQTEQFFPDSAAMKNFWHITSKTSLFVGATFYYMDPSDSIVVSLDTSDADAIGQLYIMVPGFADSALFLFTNKQSGARVNVTRALQKQIPAGTEIFFMYKHESTLKNKRYTGRNRLNTDPENKVIYPGASFVSREYGVKQGNKEYGHRWAVAGRSLDSSGKASDTIVFGFEDGGTITNPLKDSLVTADFDFNDVIFKVTGLNLNVEPYPDSLVLITSTDSTHAGDSVTCIAQVWADSAGKKIRSAEFDKLLQWKLSGDAIHKDTLISSEGTALFLPRTAFKQFSLCVSLKSPVTKDTLHDCKTVLINPGKPEKLSIELRADTANTSFNRYSPVEISRVQIPSNMVTQSLYAILRDKYGNFTGFSQATKWDTSASPVAPSLSPAVVSVRNGNMKIGEGIIDKKGIGNILVHASDVVNSVTLRDTVLVNVASVSYDSLRIGIASSDGMVYQSNVIMTTDSCKSLIAEGLRVDTRKWELVPVTWSSDRWPSTSGSTIQSEIKFCPNDTGSGFIKIDYLGYLTAKLSLKVNHGIPVRLSLYTDKNIPFNQDTTIIAGNALILRARFSDKNGIMVAVTNPNSVKWATIEQNIIDKISSGYLTDTIGVNTSFVPLRAQRTVKVFGMYGSLSDSIDIKITPGKPFRIVIESHADWKKSMYAPDEIDTIELPDNRTDKTVYAIVRDSLGNYIDSLREGTWGCNDTIITVKAGLKPCIGIISKNLQVKNGTCSVFVTNGILNDTAIVKVLPYHYIALRITSNDSISIDSLVISTNRDTVLRVQALRSDTALWRDVPADWSIKDGLFISSTGPYYSQTFSVSPTKPGQGYITARITGTDSLHDSISVRFTRGAPVRAEFDIISPSQKLIAGDTIKAVVRIYNTDGLVPGKYWFSSDSATGSSMYQDTLRFKAGRFNSRVFSGGKASFVNTFPVDTARIPQCFSDGVDTVKFIIYFAPFGTDSLHRLSVQLGALSASTASFRLKPSTLDYLTISHTHSCCPDTLTLQYPDDQVLLYAIGFDKFGNMRGGEPCNWSTTGTLHKFEANKEISRIIYGADSNVVHNNEVGFAIANSSENVKLKDSLYIKIIGPLAVPLSATTKDMNGNGLIDMIKIRFNKPVNKTKISLNSRFSIQYQTVLFPVDSIKILPDSTMDVYLKEVVNATLQTNWKPVIEFDNTGFPLGGAVETFTIEAVDGVGPVILTVRKDIMGDNRKNDLVTVTFSEEICGPDGNRFSLFQLPENVFATWYLNASGKYETMKLLTNIPNFNTPYSSDKVYFNTSNGTELTTQNYFNLRTDSSAYHIKDGAGNLPSVNNRKVKIDIFGTVENKLIIAPNPSRPTCVRQKPGVFHVEHNSSALEWISKDHGGTAISFQVVLPENNTSVGGRITIYDMVGNTVATDPKIDYKWMNLLNDQAVVSNETKWKILPSGWKANGTVYNYMVYWNGYTIGGAKAAPGIYKVIFVLYTKPDGKENVTQYKGLIGISK